MKLKALDQIHISSVKPDSLRPGEVFEVSDAAGKNLLKTHPKKLERISDGDEPEEAEGVSAKAEEAPDNKAEGAAPANKADTRRKTKGQ